VTEGYMDVVALAQWGFEHAVATLGTACTPEHVRKLFRFTDTVVFAFDGDAAGRRAARRALEAALRWPRTRAAYAFCFCRRNMTRTASCASAAPTPLPPRCATRRR
jgi:DNA primase